LLDSLFERFLDLRAPALTSALQTHQVIVDVLEMLERLQTELFKRLVDLDRDRFFVAVKLIEQFLEIKEYLPHASLLRRLESPASSNSISHTLYHFDMLDY
jgi:hypothetical protein